MNPDDRVDFDYATAFARNRGFISEEEQQRLRTARVAIAGLGGTGGAQVHALLRMGIGRLTLADPDTFELVNFNRQVIATMATIGQRKTDAAETMVKGINPECDIRLLHEGIGPESIASFLDGANIVVDSLDFYCFEERLLLYASARDLGLWVLTAPPLGFGFTLLMFDPLGMRFEDYFGFTPGMSERERVIALIAGIAPRPYLMRYLDREVVSTVGRRLPSVGAAPFLIAGVIATEVVRLLLGKAGAEAVPTVFQFDALVRKFRRHRYKRGMRGPVQRLKQRILAKRLPG